VAPARIQVVHNGIDLDRYREPDSTQRAAFRRSLGIPPGAFVVLYAGRLDPEKGVEILIDAFNLLGLAPEKGRLLIVGAPRLHRDVGAAQAYVASLRARCRADTSVWLDWQMNTVPLYGAADVAVLPSLVSETLGRTTIEAMACRRPALASRVGATSEVLFGSFERFLFPPDNPEALAAALMAMRDWREREPELGSACRDHVRTHFSLEHTVDGIERILSHAIDDQVGHRD
jgi:glycosyltransferase involved in cell wall biosynthesis